LKLSMKPDNAFSVRFKVSLDSIGRPSIERLNFLLSEAVIMGFLGRPFSKAVTSVAVW
jgi:hypothetical protein